MASKVMTEQVSLVKKTDNLNNYQSLDRKVARVHVEPDRVYSLFLNYFKLVDQLETKHNLKHGLADSHPKQSLEVKHSFKYEKFGNIFEQVILLANTNNKSISIFRRNELCYYAVCIKNNWLEKENSLNQDDIAIIQTFPQTKEAVVKEYFARCLTNFLLDLFNKSDRITQDIPWKYLDAEGSHKLYVFEIDRSYQTDRILVKGLDEQQLNIFQANVLSNKAIIVSQNDIPLCAMNQFVDFQIQQKSF